MPELRFDKYEGLGNDFIVVQAESELSFTRERAVALCDRRRGVGADGVLVVTRATDAKHVARMRILNADGSVPEMCGNGIRCVAIDLVRRGANMNAALQIETDAGVRTCVVERRGNDCDVTVDMGPARVRGRSSFAIHPRAVDALVVDVGNPHAVIFRDVPPSEHESIGRALGAHPSFPNGTNVEFAKAIGPQAIHVIVWERGVGFTQACGTGACAVAAAAIEAGIAKREEPISVTLPGGDLRIRIDEEGRAEMRGPARWVFSGVTSL